MPLIVPLLVTTSAVPAVVRVSTTPAPPLPSITAPALLIKRSINPTLIPSVLPSILPLLPGFEGFSELVSLVRTVAVVPLMPRPLAEVMLPVFKIVLLPAPRFSA